MSRDRTVVRPTAPTYAINEVVYSRISASKGYIEPLKIAKVSFDPFISEYRYSFYKDKSTIELMPITLRSSEVISLCDALDLQISFLQRELTEMEAKLSINCSSEEDPPDTPNPTIVKTKVIPPDPRFGYNEIVYLRETAESVGRLEAYRIDGLRWDSDFGEWVYKFEIRPRPRRNTTVGDRIDLRHVLIIEYPESQLSTLCEVLTLSVTFLRRAVSRAVSRKESFCGGS